MENVEKYYETTTNVSTSIPFLISYICKRTLQVVKKEVKMSKFKAGDSVANINGEAFSNGKMVCTVDYTKPNGRVGLKETDSWTGEGRLELSTTTSKPIKSNGGSSAYYTLVINDKTVETEDVIRDVFANDFDFGNAFKSLVRAYGALNGAGKDGNTVEYEMNKLRYSSKKIEKQLCN